eukprot:scaffold20768_cov138-Skeletonema_dohrnii-CCMP3373.AAC.2
MDKTDFTDGSLVVSAASSTSHHTSQVSSQHAHSYGQEARAYVNRTDRVRINSLEEYRNGK